MKVTFNNNTTGSNYYTHGLFGNGVSASASAIPGSGYSSMVVNGWSSGNAGDRYASVFDILDYANTNKNKTMRLLSGYDANGTGAIELTSGVFFLTTAISSIELNLSGGNLAEYSSFALYGIKG
jgi:hypothetical protein